MKTISFNDAVKILKRAIYLRTDVALIGDFMLDESYQSSRFLSFYEGGKHYDFSRVNNAEVGLYGTGMKLLTPDGGEQLVDVFVPYSLPDLLEKLQDDADDAAFEDEP